MNMLSFASITFTNNQFHFHSLRGVFLKTGSDYNGEHTNARKGIKNKIKSHCSVVLHLDISCGWASLRPKNHIPLFPTGSFSASCGFYLYMRVALTSIGVSWVTACQRGSLVLVPISCAIFLLYKTPESSAPVHYSSSPRASVCLPHPVSTVGLAQFPTGLKKQQTERICLGCSGPCNASTASS